MISTSSFSNILRLALCCLACLLPLMLDLEARAQEDPAVQRTQSGLQALQSQKFDAAAEEFREALKGGVKDERKIADLNFYLGVTWQMQADASDPKEKEKIAELRSKAKNAFMKATLLRPESAGSWNNLALVCSRLGDNETASNAFRKAIALGTSDQATFLLNYADFLMGSDKAEDALRFYQEVVTLEPTNVRARDAIDQYYLTKRRPQLVSYVWRLFEEGHIDWAQDAALKGLETSAESERGWPQLLNCVVRSSGKQDYEPRALPGSALGKRLAALGDKPRFADAIKELFLLHTAENPSPDDFPWWSRQLVIGGNTQAPPGGWPQEGFSELIRSIGEKYEARKDHKAAERYYRLAFELTQDFLDPIAIIKLADLWIKMDQESKLKRFLDEFEFRIFLEKSEAIQKKSYKRIYEIHRALALVYAHINQWKSNDAFHNAEFQMQAALQDASRFNAADSKLQPQERIADWQLVEKLAKRYEGTGREAEAFMLRVTQAKEFQRAQKGAEATQVFRPIASKEPPREITDESKKTFQTLKVEFAKEGFKSLPVPGAPKEARFNFKTPGGKDIQVLLGLPESVTRDDVNHLPDLIQKLMEGDAAPRTATKPHGTGKVRLLSKTDETKNVDKVQLQGRQGSVDLKIDGKSVRVPFSIDSPAGSDEAKSFKYVRP